MCKWCRVKYKCQAHSQPSTMFSKEEKVRMVEKAFDRAIEPTQFPINFVRCRDLIRRYNPVIRDVSRIFN